MQSCEPIEIKFTSFTNLQIGTAFVSIPNQICDFFDSLQEGQHNVHNKSQYKIFSPNNRILGSINISFDIQFIVNQTPRSTSTVATVVKTLPKQIDQAYLCHKKLNSSPKLIEIENILTSTMTLPKVLKENISNKPLRVKKSSKAYNYLTGHEMSKDEELQALSEIKLSSPTGSLVEALSQSATGRRQIYKLLNEIDSLKISLKTLYLTRAGMREANFNQKMHEANPHTFMVEGNPYVEGMRMTVIGKDALRFTSKNVNFMFSSKCF